MSSYADLALYNRNSQLTAVAEVNNTRDTSRDWTTRQRCHILSHGGHHNADFVLLVTLDERCRWQNADTMPTLSEPHHEINAEPVLAPCFANAGVDLHNVSGHALLVESGCLTAVRDGRLAYEVTV